MNQDPDGEIENSAKSIFEIRIPNFCCIQVIVFDLGYLPVAAVGTQQVRHHEKIVKNIKSVLVQIPKVKNYNLNVTEIRDSDFKNAFRGIFNFTVGILVRGSMVQGFWDDLWSVDYRGMIVKNSFLSKVKWPFVHCHYSPDE